MLSSIENLPDDIFLHIIADVATADMLSLCSTSTFMRRKYEALKDIIWTTLLPRDYPHDTFPHNKLCYHTPMQRYIFWKRLDDALWGDFAYGNCLEEAMRNAYDNRLNDEVLRYYIEEMEILQEEGRAHGKLGGGPHCEENYMDEETKNQWYIALTYIGDLHDDDIEFWTCGHLKEDTLCKCMEIAIESENVAQFRRLVEIARDRKFCPGIMQDYFDDYKDFEGIMIICEYFPDVE